MLKSLRDLGFAKTGSEEAILEESALLIKNINKGKNCQTNFKNKFYLYKAKKKIKKIFELSMYVHFNFEPIQHNCHQLASNCLFFSMTKIFCLLILVEIYCSVFSHSLSLTHMAYFSQCDADNFFFISLTLDLIFSYFL